MRPILSPGTHVLRRGDGSTQVGLDPSTRVVLPASAATTTTLRRLGSAVAREDYDDVRTLDLLAERGLVVDQGAVFCSAAEAPPARHAAAAVAQACGSTAQRTYDARSRAHLDLLGFGHPVGLGLPEQLAGLVAEAGVATAGNGSRACVLLGVGEPERELLDGWTREGTPHLLVRFTEGRAVVGPFVVGGRTACLRCIDAHRTDADPAWPLLVRQYTQRSASERPDGVPEPLDPLLVRMALVWAAHDVTAYVDGRRPWTWSATLTIAPQLGDLETTGWLRHPECGCSPA